MLGELEKIVTLVLVRLVASLFLIVMSIVTVSLLSAIPSLSPLSETSVFVT